MSTVLVIAEASQGAIRRATLELLTAARQLGDPVVLLSGGGPELAAELGRYGASAVRIVPDDVTGSYLSVPLADAATELARALQPSAVLITSGPTGKDVAARMAVDLNAGIATEAIDVRAEGDTIVVKQSIFAGTDHATSEIVRGPAIITMRPGTVSAEAAADNQPAVEDLVIDLTDAARGTEVTDRTPKQSSGRPDLADAPIVVTGGRGVGSAEGFGVIEQVADRMQGAVGATRAVTDADWVSHDLQIGQTGKTVSPSLYIAAGVSGAIQHRAGMQTAKTIVAINTDPKAPIFKVADFGVVGDLHVVLPAVLQELDKQS